MRIALSLRKVFSFKFSLIFKTAVYFTLKPSSVFSGLSVFRIVGLLQEQLLIRLALAQKN